jgi:hypothetical protein
MGWFKIHFSLPLRWSVAADQSSQIIGSHPYRWGRDETRHQTAIQRHNHLLNSSQGAYRFCRRLIFESEQN